MAGTLAADGYSVAVLNMANGRHPGGGYKNGAGAQEENLHRRSDAVRFTEGQDCRYPIPKDGCLSSRGVSVFRGKESDGYPWINVFHITMLSCAAINRPQLTREGDDYSRPSQRWAMENKVAAIIGAAEQAEVDVVILSAFGCGAFKNPPAAVARMFKKELEKASLRSVFFCIFEDHNSRRDHNPRGNFQPFYDVFFSSAA